MNRKQKIAGAVIVVLLGAMAFAALLTDYSNPVTVSAPHVELNNAWMRAVRGRDYATLNNLTCHPSEQNIATIREQVESIQDILHASTGMQLHEVTKVNPEHKTIVIRTKFTLRRSVRGETEYTGAILINSSTHQYCVLGFALDQAFWPARRQQVQD